MRGLSPVAASGGHSSSRCTGLSLSRPLLLRSTGSRRAGSVVVAHRPSCSAACGIFPDQGWNPCPLHWQADSQTLRHQGSSLYNILEMTKLQKCKQISCQGLDKGWCSGYGRATGGVLLVMEIFCILTVPLSISQLCYSTVLQDATIGGKVSNLCYFLQLLVTPQLSQK